MKSRTSDLMAVYDVLLNAFGPQNWWPGDGPLEVLVGAVLTQNTSWKNVELALGNLGVIDMEQGRLEEAREQVGDAELEVIAAAEGMEIGV